MQHGGPNLDPLTEPVGQTGTDPLTEPVIELVTDLQRRFGGEIDELLAARTRRRQRVRAGERLTFRPETEPVRRQPWTVEPAPKDLEDRRVELTGPPTPAFITAAVDSGAAAVMVDFEDACSTRWDDVAAGHRAVRDYFHGRLVSDPDGPPTGPVHDGPAVIVGVRAWHRTEPGMTVDERPVSAPLLDLALTAVNNARAALDAGSGPYFSLPKLESHEEAGLWARVIDHVEDRVGLDRGSIRVTVLIETIFAAFEMDEILHELRGRACGLNAGRSDYLFSLARTFAHDPAFVLPDRDDIRTETPFMRAFAALLVATCHRRATHAVGGVSPDFPTGAGQGTLPRTEDLGPEPGLDRVRAEKRREAGDGFDGTLVAHPATVALARAEFDRVLGDRPNQLAVQRDDVYITPGDLLAVGSTIGAITERGVRGAVEVVEAFLAAQLRGEGTVAVDGVVIDRAAAELHRVQLWQWVHQQVELDNGLTLTAEVAHRLIAEQLETMRNRTGTGEWPRLGYAEAGSLLLKLTFASELVEHLAEVLPGSDDQPRIAVTTPNTHEGAPA